MKLKSLTRLLMIALMTSFFSAVCQSQTQVRSRTRVAAPSPRAPIAENLPSPPKILQRLDDGSIAVEIDGLKYLAITAAQLREWTKLQNNYDGCQKENQELTGQVQNLIHQRELVQNDVKTWAAKSASFEADFARAREDTRLAREDAARNFSLFTTERELRVEAQQFIPHSNPKGIAGKILNALDSAPVQIGFKLLIPAVQFGRVMSQSCGGR